MRVMGIDPGSNFLGLGCVEAKGNSFSWIDHKVIRLNSGGTVPHELRLKSIYENVQEALGLWTPTAVAVEEVFFAKNAQSALKLGQARGAAIVAAALRELPVFEYSATLIKQTVTGSGRAEKEQVQKMIRAILGAAGGTLQFDRDDASDALAIAICHLQHRHRARVFKNRFAGPAHEGKTSL